ncbi:DNA polymerase III subunit alpha [Prolixibacter denitrificans]|uniref:DNA polymerase III subunit alpha n=1 Tax=Prolixibacter denitrificans TaxID=1541063 RepID=A0A2P8CKZ0_9BACT|nr:DNA polymerase III subunit alpha [Prolixibacter denitrificans]PSK85593.1 DNA polymerase-3 subunit alpha [Prolixibacter denitrificans]GET20213.1 DNA-directed DNA polymerase [Prolixibacter denitrificans]
MIPFTHLHVHSQYSILDGAASVPDLVTKAKNDGMKAVALTDHGSMFGMKEFHATCKANGMKPILGCETYVAARSLDDKSDKVDRSGNHLILLAKNEKGYRNLLKLVSIANTRGMYYKPRIDKTMLEKYHEGIIVSSACLGGEIPQLVMRGDIPGAEKAIEWYKSVFGDDYYLELQRHRTDDPRMKMDVYDKQVMVNEVLVGLAKKYNVKIIAANDVHFTNEEDAEAHDLLICLNTGKDIDDPNRMRYTRQEWFKTTAEMNELFSDVPEALANTQEIVDKVEFFELDSSPIMPEFPIPESFGTLEEFRNKFSEDELKEEFGEAYDRMGGYDKVIRVKFEADYLKHLVYKGAEWRYGEAFSGDNKERIDFELETIKTMGFPGYFLIVQDFINAAREMGVIVGPGRGSAAGSAVAYCTGITNVDPIKYDLLFERFLNPDRVSMPDIDIDFDDDGRQLVLDWVTDKYGHDKVAHICTFGTMAAKLALRDVARVLKLPLPEADRLAKMVPEAPKMTLQKAYKENPQLEMEKQSENLLVAKTLRLAETLEGSVRQTGVHACGVLIGKNPLDEHLPVMPTKEEELLTTQYDGRFVEDIGLLKMDFLGLKTLSIIKECLDNIKLSRGIDIDIDALPPDDQETFELFGRGDTTAIFQFESPGMKKWLRKLKPNRFEDLVAMNALYRPGPMEYIPNFVNRKHGYEEIVYDHPMMEPFLNDTYGITVFQEQVMLQSRALGQFTRGESDTLRKAMGKKKFDLMAKLKVKFHDGCLSNEKFVEGCKEVGQKPEKLIDKIWKDWEAFASYAFNKSHSVCYAYIAYQTGYLKAHYPAEFMAAVLSRNLSNSDKISIFMDESNHMGLPVLGPDVNESRAKFFVNKKGDLRFGMAAIKGVGNAAVDEIIREREENGEFKDLFDFVERVNLQTVNKKNIESLAMAGAFDSFGDMKRAQFFAENNEGVSFIESLVRYGGRMQSEKQNAMASLFGGANAVEVKKPDIPNVPEWPRIVLLDKEKNLIGIYLSAHPLDDYKLEIESFCTKGVNLAQLKENIDAFRNRDITFAGMVTEAHEGISKNGKPFSTLTLTDYSESHKIYFFGNDYVNFGKYCRQGLFLLVKGKVQPRWRDSNDWEFKVNKIDLLSELRGQVKSVMLEIPVETVTNEFLKDLGERLNGNNGSTLLKFAVFDAKNNLRVQMFSRNKRIELTDELVEYFQNNPDIAFTIN